MFRRNKRLCSSCKTGRDSYKLDRRSEMCPYIGCYEINKCAFYIPLETCKQSLWDKLLDIVAPPRKNKL